MDDENGYSREKESFMSIVIKFIIRHRLRAGYH